MGEGARSGYIHQQSHYNIVLVTAGPCYSKHVNWGSSSLIDLEVYLKKTGTQFL